MNNQNIILVGSAGKPSMKALLPHLSSGILLEKIELKKGEFIRVHKDRKDFSKVTTVKKSDVSIRDSVVIRWGNRIPMIMGNSIVYNQASGISNSSNKKTARKMLDAAKIPIPKLVTPDNFKELDLPIIGRPSFHSKCKNLRVLKTKEEFVKHYEEKEKKGWYYSQFIDKEREIRVHCAHGKVLSVSEKPKPKNHNKNNIVVGWGFSLVEEEWKVLHWSEYKALWCKIALEAVKTFGLDFGAVDLMLKDDKCYVLEVNTAGSLTESPYLQKRYSMYFNWLFSTKEKREHWDFSKFESGKGLAWKNFQLNDK